MKDGFIKVAAAVAEIRVADCEYNANNIIKQMHRAEELGVKVLVFPELCVTAYTCADLFLQDTLLDGAEAAVERIIEASRDTDAVTMVGAPVRKDGKLYDCAVIMQRGQLLAVVPKSNIPNYGEFYERRIFAPAPKEMGTVIYAGQEALFGTKLLLRCTNMLDLCIGAEVSEDMSAPEAPAVCLASEGATVIANLAASDEIVGKAENRRLLVRSQSARLCCGYIFANAGEGESTTDLVFSGHSMIAEKGAILSESRLYTTGLTVTEIDVSRLVYERRRTSTFPQSKGDCTEIGFELKIYETELTRSIPKHPFVPAAESERAERCESILAIQTQGLKKRLQAAHSQAAVIGISGGLDSTLALLVTVRAFDALGLDRKSIICPTMPCYGTTERTLSNAKRLCESLGVTLKVIDITAAVDLHFEDIEHDPSDHSVTYENAQARERTQVLMDIANKINGLVVGTGDLSEMALGWATYNGDHMSMYGVNCSIPKTLVRHLVRYCADTADSEVLRDTLIDIFETPVSPELLPPTDGKISQKTEEVVGPYELHDFFLYGAIRWAFAPRKLLRLAKYAFADVYDDETILKWLKTFYRRFFTQQFKRSCVPDGPKVGTVALSPRGDWRMPSDASSALFLAQLDEQ